MDTNKTDKPKNIPTPQTSQGDIIEKAQEMSENWIEKGFGKDIPKAGKKDKKTEPEVSKDTYRNSSVFIFD